MHIIRKAYCRTFQTGMKYAMYLMPWRRPELIEGEDALGQLAQKLKKENYGSVLVVTDEGLAKIGLQKRLTDKLDAAGVDYALYDKTIANPTIANVEEALQVYHTSGCRAIVAIGGGSAMDCAKVVGARVAKPRQPVEKMKGILKIWKKTPPFYAIPTTAGTGSETTLAAVITDQKTRHKYPINDFMLIPDYAVLAPELTADLPQNVTSTTGMDALTHAVEAYIGRSNTKQTEKDAKAAVKLVFTYLRRAYEDGHDMEARIHMQEAAYLAGAAFTRAYVGNIHAMAHALGGAYRIPHGFANAVILPYVLDYYGDTVYGRLAELAQAAGIAEEDATEEENAKRFIRAVREMNRSMKIPEKLKGIQQKHLPKLAGWAEAEANPLYPVPVLFDRKDFQKLYLQVMDTGANSAEEQKMEAGKR